MSEVLVRRPHHLPLMDARHLAESIAGRLRADFGGTYAWEGDTLCFRRTGASGHVAVSDHDVEVHVTISFLLSPVHGRIEREIVAFCDEYLGPAASSRSQPARPAAARRRLTRSSRSQGASRSPRPK